MYLLYPVLYRMVVEVHGALQLLFVVFQTALLVQVQLEVVT